MSTLGTRIRAFADAGVFTDKVVLASLIVNGEDIEIHRQIDTKVTPPFPGSYEAEIMAVFETLKNLLTRGIKDAIVFTDCLPIITVIEHPKVKDKLSKPNTRAKHMLKRIRAILSQHPNIKLRKIHRKKNLAHLLIHNGFLFPLLEMRGLKEIL